MIAKMTYCKVLLTNSLQNFSDAQYGALSYSIPHEIKERLVLGSLVLVPFRNVKQNALVIDIYENLSIEESKFKIREIDSILENHPLIDSKLIELFKFAANYYACSLQDVVNMALPKYLLAKPRLNIQLLNPDSKDSLALILAKARKQNLSRDRLKFLSGLSEDKFKKSLTKLIQQGIVSVNYEKSKTPKRSKFNHLDRLSAAAKLDKPELTQAQERVLSQIEQRQQASKILLYGVTGSGKTEIYLRLIEETLKQNKNVIFLVPEISLAPQTISRVMERFGDQSVLVWHSALSPAEKKFSYQALNDNLPKIIVGARSAVFAPVQNLGLVIIDEEHENSYKQEDLSPKYHAVKIAEKRSELSSCHLILGSATPNIETYYKALCKDYLLCNLDQRIFANPLPKVSLVDMKIEFEHANKSIFSRQLRDSIVAALDKKEQIILYLNKRGNASHVFCRSCGFVYNCPNCDSKITYHSDRKIMLCHHCNHTQAHPNECPLCNSSAIKFFGLGTQKLEIETARSFPKARISRLDSDVSKDKKSYIEILEKFKNHELDILIGTQMIAKGLDNPNVTVVGVILADTNISQIDFQADQRAFQLLTQVAGRAGRKEKEGLAIIQTYQPESEILDFAKQHDYRAFYQREIQLRAKLLYPPFVTLIKFRSSNPLESQAIAKLNILHKAICDELKPELEDSSLALLGPCPSFITRLNNNYRYNLLVKIIKNSEHDRIFEKLKQIYFKLDLDMVSIDIDAIS